MPIGRAGSNPAGGTNMFDNEEQKRAYSYILGLYLGDGYINVQNKKYGVYFVIN